MNDIMLAMASRCVTLLVLLDLSPAFDTVNHELQGTVMNWFKPYLSNRGQWISISGTLSGALTLIVGCPRLLFGTSIIYYLFISNV